MLLWAMGSALVQAKPQAGQLAWMEGRWRGPAFGGTVTEIFTSPEGGCVLGTSRIIGNDGRLMQKEFMDISETPEGSLAYTITLPGRRHTFLLASIGPNSVEWSDPANPFPSNISYSRSGDVMTILLKGKSADGEPRTTKIEMKRAPHD